MGMASGSVGLVLGRGFEIDGEENDYLSASGRGGLDLLRKM
jgi:hypothetical protein